MTETKTIEDLIASLPEDRRAIFSELRRTINNKLPKGFSEAVSNNGILWSVPHSTYPEGYHCDPSQPLPFIGVMSQKNHIGIYHMGIYSDLKLLQWFTDEWPKHSDRKLDMGKSCIRIKKPENVPVKLIGELASKMTPKEWINCYETILKR